MPEPIADLSRLAVHTMTLRPWSLAECVEHLAGAGVAGVSVWRNAIEPMGIDEAARLVKASRLAVPALVRGGFFPAPDEAARAAALDENRRCIDEAAALGAAMVVLVVGAVPGLPLAEARGQVEAGIAAVLDHAEQAGVQLAIEPLHPMYAADKSCINTLAQAREIWEIFPAELVGVAVDVYHVWWDGDLEAEIALAGRAGRLFAFHLCDWRVETRHLLTDRGLMGDGCIDLPRIRACVEAAGFAGYHEVEVFSEQYWAMDQSLYLDRIVRAYRAHA